MPAESDPPRKHYGFKEREFPREKARTDAIPPAPTAADLAKLAHPDGPTRQTPVPSTRAKAGDPNDVHALLRENRAAEQQHGADVIEIQKIKRRRWRDYWIVLIAGNALIVGTLLLGSLNVVSVMFAFAGVILFSLSFTWIMWQVIGRY